MTQLRDGFDYTRRDSRVATVLVLVGFHCGFTMAFDSMMPTLATDIGGDSGTYGSILVGLGAGAVVGVLSLSMLKTPQAQGRAFFIAAVGSGLAMLTFGFATVPAAAIAGATLAGGTQASFMALSVVFIQQIVPDEYRGRVLSLYSLLAAGHMALINLGFGWLSEIVGVRRDDENMIVEWVERLPREDAEAAEAVTTPFVIAGVPAFAGEVQFAKLAAVPE